MGEFSKVVLNKAAVRDMQRMLHVVKDMLFDPAYETAQYPPPKSEADRRYARTARAAIDEAHKLLEAKSTLTEKGWQALCDEAMQNVCGRDGTLAYATFKKQISAGQIKILFEAVASEQREKAPMARGVASD